MKYSLKFALTAALLATGISAAQAETVTTTETTTTVETDVVTEGTTRFDITELDIDNDEIISVEEVGEKLFYIYDTDGNEVIDNTEYDNPSVVTVVPMEKETVHAVDFDNDGKAEQTTYTYDRFMKRTGLAMFDRDNDGLSAKDFLGGTAFMQADINGNHTIDLKEWKSTYSTEVQAMDDSERFN